MAEIIFGLDVGDLPDGWRPQRRMGTINHTNIMLCRRCLLEPARRGNLGAACLRYQQRTGQLRPGTIIIKHAARLSDKAAMRRTQT